MTNLESPPVSLLEAVFCPMWALVVDPPLHPSVIRSYQGCYSPSVPVVQDWLPTLCRFLATSWVDTTVVTDKAVKRDDASVQVNLRDT
jgi:hypothetical protein